MQCSECVPEWQSQFWVCNTCTIRHGSKNFSQAYQDIKRSSLVSLRTSNSHRRLISQEFGPRYSHKRQKSGERRTSCSHKTQLRDDLKGEQRFLPTWQRAFSRMETTRPCVGWMRRRLCGSARPTTVGWISSYHMRPKQPCRPPDLPCLYVTHHRGQSRSPVGRNTVVPGQPAPTTPQSIYIFIYIFFKWFIQCKGYPKPRTLKIR